MSYVRTLTICLLLVYFVSAAGCHCFDFHSNILHDQYCILHLLLLLLSLTNYLLHGYYSEYPRSVGHGDGLIDSCNAIDVCPGLIIIIIMIQGRAMVWKNARRLFSNVERW